MLLPCLEDLSLLELFHCMSSNGSNVLRNNQLPHPSSFFFSHVVLQERMCSTPDNLAHMASQSRVDSIHEWAILWIALTIAPSTVRDYEFGSLADIWISRLVESLD